MRRVLLSPRWLALHALAVVLVVAFLYLGWWQLRRGVSGNDRSWGYAAEWPVFAVFVVIMWWRMARDAVRAGGPDRPAGADSGTVHDAGPVPGGLPATLPSHGAARPAADDAAPDEELAAYNRYLARLNADAAAGGSGRTQATEGGNA